jgi:hypothetical protein
MTMCAFTYNTCSSTRGGHVGVVAVGPPTHGKPATARIERVPIDRVNEFDRPDDSGAMVRPRLQSTRAVG